MVHVVEGSAVEGDLDLLVRLAAQQGLGLVVGCGALVCVGHGRVEQESEGEVCEGGVTEEGKSEEGVQDRKRKNPAPRRAIAKGRQQQ